MGHDDAEMVQGWQRGDAAAFEALVDRWQMPVARMLCRLVGPKDAVQDLCQEVFLKVYRGRVNYRGEAAFSTWLYRIALNVARDHMRRDRRPFVSLNGHEPPQVAPRNRQSDAADLVRQALAELPEPLREVVVLRHYEQMKFEEMARVTGTPASTLKSRFTLALQKLREHLDRQGLGPEEAV